jgi:phosphoribosylformimino-5-aminoimidazole carboxamide ribotide isomerase
VTSYVFKDGRINFDNLEKISKTVGRDKLVLDLSCRLRDGRYYIVTDRWQKFTDEVICDKTLDMLSKYCDEFLIHAVDVEGKSQGIEHELVSYLGKWRENNTSIPITYAGGVHSYEDIELLYKLGNGKINVTIGSALDIFGGSLSFNKITDMIIKKLCS